MDGRGEEEEAIMERYTKIKTIGKGSYGYAVLVQENSSKKHFVMKVIDISPLDRKQKEEALNEIHVLRAMRHPYIVTYVESFLEKRCLCIVMEYAEGGDLYTRLGKMKERHQRLTEKQVTDWFLQICLALKYIHDRKILHRDLKSQNIFLTAKGEVKLGDFGISRVLQNTYDCANTIIGTPYYLSPEMCQEQPYNQKSDIWSLGCILYEMMALKHAFAAKNMKGLVLKILRGTYDPVPDDYSGELRALLGELLAREPTCRPSIKKILGKEFLRAKLPRVVSGGGELFSTTDSGVEKKSTKVSTETSESGRHLSYEVSPVKPNEGDDAPDLMETGTLRADEALEYAEEGKAAELEDRRQKQQGLREIVAGIPGVLPGDSLSSAAESMRYYLEHNIGPDRLLLAYQYLTGHPDSPDLRRKLEQMDVKVVQVVHQLVLLEEAAFARN